MISEIRYQRIATSEGTDEGIIEVIISCMNNRKGYEFETIKLIFSGILGFRFSEFDNISTLIINEAYIVETNNIVTVDFFPQI